MVLPLLRSLIIVKSEELWAMTQVMPLRAAWLLRDFNRRAFPGLDRRLEVIRQPILCRERKNIREDIKETSSEKELKCTKP